MICLWEILVPTADNEGKPFRTRYHKVWDAKVKKLTGGLTILSVAKGEWVNDMGTTYEDRLIPVRVACTREVLDEILPMTKDYYRQEAIFAFKVSEEVIIYS